MGEIRNKLNQLFQNKTFLGIGIGTWVFIFLFLIVIGTVISKVPPLRRLVSKIPILKKILSLNLTSYSVRAGRRIGRGIYNTRMRYRRMRNRFSRYRGRRRRRRSYRF